MFRMQLYLRLSKFINKYVSLYLFHGLKTLLSYKFLVKERYRSNKFAKLGFSHNFVNMNHEGHLYKF